MDQGFFVDKADLLARDTSQINALGKYGTKLKAYGFTPAGLVKCNAEQIYALDLHCDNCAASFKESCDSVKELFDGPSVAPKLLLPATHTLSHTKHNIITLHPLLSREWSCEQIGSARILFHCAL